MADLMLTRAWFDALRALANDQRRVADALLELLYHHPTLPLFAGDTQFIALTGAVRASQADLAELAGVSRKAVRRTLAALAKSGAIDLAADEGQLGSVIAIRGALWVRRDVDGAGLTVAEARRESAGPVVSALIERIRSGSVVAPSKAGQVAGQVKQTSAGQVARMATSRGDSGSGDRDREAGQVENDRSGQVKTCSIAPSPTGYPQASESGIVDESPSGAAALHDHGDPDLTVRPLTNDLDPSSTPTPAADPDPLSPFGDSAKESKRNQPRAAEGAAPKRSRIRRTAEVPAVAGEMADLFRRYCLSQQPGHTIGKALPWPTHPTRSKWAIAIDKLVRSQAAGPIDQPRVYALIARMLTWLASDQGTTDPKYRMIVLSIGALNEKWDRVLARVNLHTPASRAAAEPAPVHASSQRQLAIAPPRQH